MKKILIVGMIVLLSGCSISKNVVKVDSKTAIQKIHILKNNNDHMAGFYPELISQIRTLGFEAGSYDGDRPKDALHYLTYRANWTWDLAMYLVYFHATLYEDGKVIGEVEYDAKMGGANMSKFGHTADKIRPLLNELFINVARAK